MYDHYTGPVLRLQLSTVSGILDLRRGLHGLDCGLQNGVFAGQVGHLDGQFVDNNVYVWLWVLICHGWDSSAEMRVSRDPT